MARIVSLNRKKKKRRVYALVLTITLLTAAGILFRGLPLSLQHIGSLLQVAVSNFTDNPTKSISLPYDVRGTIYDVQYHELAITYQLYKLSIHSAELGDREKVVRSLSSILGEEQTSLASMLNQSCPVIEIPEKLDEQQAERIRKLNIKGIYLTPAQNRFYPEHSTAAHLIGFSEHNIGLAGVEGFYDTVLRSGEFKASDVPEIDFENESMIGHTKTDIILTIDINVQKHLESKLSLLEKKLDLNKISAIVMNPRNGAVKAMAILPTFNPNYFWQSSEENIHDTLFTKNIDLATIDEIFLPIAPIIKKNDPNALVLPEGVIACDHGLSSEDMDIFNKRIGIISTDGYYLPGQIESTKKQTPYDQLEQRKNKSASLIQLAAAMSSLINGGWIIKPYVLHGIFDHNIGKTFIRIQNDTDSSTNRIMSPAMGVRIRKTLADEKWSGNSNIQIISKENQNVLHSKNKSRYLREFILIGWMPRNNPEILLLLSGLRTHLAPEHISVHQEKEIMDAEGLAILNASKKQNMIAVKKQFPIIKNHDNYEQFLISRNIHLYKPQELPDPKTVKTMPDITGLSLRNALKRLNYLNLKISIEGSGHIISQTPAAGTSISENMECTLILAEKN